MSKWKTLKIDNTPNYRPFYHNDTDVYLCVGSLLDYWSLNADDRVDINAGKACIKVTERKRGDKRPNDQCIKVTVPRTQDGLSNGIRVENQLTGKFEERTLTCTTDRALINAGLLGKTLWAFLEIDQ